MEPDRRGRAGQRGEAHRVDRLLRREDHRERVRRREAVPLAREARGDEAPSLRHVALDGGLPGLGDRREAARDEPGVESRASLGGEDGDVVSPDTLRLAGPDSGIEVPPRRADSRFGTSVSQPMRSARRSRTIPRSARPVNPNRITRRMQAR
jgi:hypothetical protein